MKYLIVGTRFLKPIDTIVTGEAGTIHAYKDGNYIISCRRSDITEQNPEDLEKVFSNLYRRKDRQKVRYM